MGITSGALVTDSLRIVDKLGEGGMGSVWVADDLARGGQVAVKLIAGELLARDPTLVQRFEREARAAAELKSPHVVRILEHGVTADGTPYIAMERLEGETLDDRLQREPLALDGVVAIVEQLAEVLDEAHGRGIVHRDIKPANVFLLAGEALFVKVLDFGIAKQAALHAAPLTATDAMVGTPAYMSPEHIAASKHVSHHADVWALGVVAYQAITGELPFAGRTLGATILAIQQQRFRLPSQIDAQLPAALDELFARAFAGALDARFAAAGDFARALRAAIGDGGARAGRAQAAPDAETFSPSAATLRERRRSLGGGWLAGVLAAMVASAVAFQYVDPGKPLRLEPVLPAVLAHAVPLMFTDVSAATAAPVST